MKSKIHLSLDGDNLIIKWDNKLSALEKALHDAGARFLDFNSYTTEFSLSSARMVFKCASKFGDVTATKELKARLRDEKAELERLDNLLSADGDAELSPLLVEQAPETAKSLRPYQRAGVAFISSREATLLADHPGSGKTLQAIAGIISAGVEGDILVLAPSIAAQVTWPAELKRWAPNDEVMVVTGSRFKREKTLLRLRKKSKMRRRWVVCNLEMAKTKYHKAEFVGGEQIKAHWTWQFPELYFLDYEVNNPKNPRLWASILVDESHRALVTTKTAHYAQSQQRSGMAKLHVKPGGKRIAMSGTPFRGKLENTWGTLNWLLPKSYPSYWPWVERWFEIAENKKYTPNGEVSETKIFGLRDGVEQSFYQSLRPIMIRRTKREIAPWLPDKLYAGSVPPNVLEQAQSAVGDMAEQAMIGHWLSMPPKQQKAYAQMQEEAIANLANGTLVANGVLAEMTRLKQFAGCFGDLERFEDSDGFEDFRFIPAMPSNKFNWLLEFLDELGINKDTENEHGPNAQKVVVASQFTSILDLFAAELKKKGISSLKITGKVSAKARKQAVETFQSDNGPKVLFLNTKAGGVALTLDRADDLVILDETFIPDDQEQVEDRIHRVSRNHKVTIHYVRSIGTIEQSIAEKTAERDSVQKQILDSERGVQYARKLLR